MFETLGIDQNYDFYYIWNPLKYYDNNVVFLETPHKMNLQVQTANL
jgi:hypothetical protein